MAAKTITFTVQNEVAYQRLLDGWSAGYSATVPGPIHPVTHRPTPPTVSNPVTQEAFARQRMIDFLVKQVVAIEALAAAEKARLAAIADVQAKLVII